VLKKQMKRTVLAAIALLTACGAPGTATIPSTAPSPTLSVAPTSRATPSAPGSNAKELSGELPAIDVVSNSRGDIQQAGGFVHFPGGGFALDPAARMLQDPNTHLLRTAIAPYLYGSNDSGRGRITFDPVVKRWLPVSADQLSADGLHYAYAAPIFPAPTSSQAGPGPFAIGVSIHVVDVLSAGDSIVFSSDGQPFYTVVASTQQTIYLTAACAEGCGQDSLKLWRLDAPTGILTKVSDLRGFGWSIRGQVAWVATYNEGGHPGQLIRLSLTNGQVQVWLGASGMELIGFDADGNPLVTLNDAGASALIRVTAPQQSEKLFSGPSNGQLSAAVADGQGTWLGGGQSGGQGIYLFMNATGMQKVSDFPGLPLGPPIR
jgi:hypothetical protein